MGCKYFSLLKCFLLPVTKQASSSDISQGFEVYKTPCMERAALASVIASPFSKPYSPLFRHSEI